MQACKLIVWNFECRKSERMSFSFLFILLSVDITEILNDIIPLNQIHKTVCDSDIFHLSYYLWSGSTFGIRIHFRGKIIF